MNEQENPFLKSIRLAKEAAAAAKRLREERLGSGERVGASVQGTDLRKPVDSSGMQNFRKNNKRNVPSTR